MEINWFSVLIIYIGVVISFFLCCLFYHALCDDYINKEDWIEIISLSLFWPIYALKKITDVIVKVLCFLFEVLKKLINDIFKI